ncbi:hypothetical protein MFLAVUS_001238 [Mucor flavus]|uniref:Sel1 repeat family protein n=1 Tax=Mucor flavus TaxID=439312 RepID=A0ABP9YLZ3_9FUNG
MQRFARMYFGGQKTAKDYHTALYWFKEAFDKGDDDSESFIGIIYTFGENGVDRDFDLAEIWCTKETSRSILIRGVLYGVRDDSKQSWEKAFECATKVAGFNFGNAQVYLGHIYQLGLGREKDYKLAMDWYKKAKEKGDRDAMARIGVMYHYRYVVSIKYSEALTLYQKAGNCGEALNGTLETQKI